MDENTLNNEKELKNQNSHAINTVVLSIQALTWINKMTLLFGLLSPKTPIEIFE